MRYKLNIPPGLICIGILPMFNPEVSLSKSNLMEYNSCIFPVWFLTMFIYILKDVRYSELSCSLDTHRRPRQGKQCLTCPFPTIFCNLVYPMTMESGYSIIHLLVSGATGWVEYVILTQLQNKNVLYCNANSTIEPLYKDYFE